MNQDKSSSGTASGVIAVVLFVVGVFLTREIMAPPDERLLPSLTIVSFFGPIIAALGLGLGFRYLKFGRHPRSKILTVIGATLGIAGVALVATAGVIIGWTPDALGLIGMMATIFLITPGVILFIWGNLTPKPDPDSDDQSQP